jgi:protein-S-isoprenylcysteine O-methyltransferase Ste14
MDSQLEGRTKDRRQDTPGVIAPPPLIYAAALIAGLILHAMYPVRFLPSTLTPVMGWSLIGAGIFLIVAGFRAMHRAHTPVDPYKPSTAIVVEGPYRFSRNPLYVSLTIVYVGIAMLINTLWVLLLLPVILFIIRRGVIDREERYLEQKFGEEYLRYKANVRRWI